MMLALVLSTLFGATAHVPVRIKSYLVAVCAAAPLLWLGAHWFGEKSPEYAFEYYAVTSVILFTILAVAVGSRMTVLTAVIGTCVAILMVLLTYDHLPTPTPFYDWFYLAESSVLGGCGASLLFQTYQLPRRDIYAAIGLLWLSQAAFRASFALNQPEAIWLKRNEWVPAGLVCAAFLWIGFRARLIRWKFEATS